MKLSNKQAETIVAALHYWAREIEADPDFESGLTELETYRLAKEFDYLTGGPNRRHGLRCKLSTKFSMDSGLAELEKYSVCNQAKPWKGERGTNATR